MSDAERTVQRQLKIITEPSIAAIVELYFNKYDTHIPKGSTDSTGIRERSQRATETARRNKQEREREKERVRQADRSRHGNLRRLSRDLSSSHPVWNVDDVPNTILTSSRSFFPLSCVPAVYILFLHSMGLIWVFLHLDIVARLPELRLRSHKRFSALST